MELKIPSKFDDLYFDEAGEYGYDLISERVVAIRNLQLCGVDCSDRFGVSLDDSPSDRDLQLSEALSGNIPSCSFAIDFFLGANATISL